MVVLVLTLKAKRPLKLAHNVTLQLLALMLKQLQVMVNTISFAYLVAMNGLKNNPLVIE